MAVRYLLSICLVARVAGTPADRSHHRYGRAAVQCRAPYEAVGRQCLFFSRPYADWGITDSWREVSRISQSQSEVCVYFLN